MSIEAWTWRQWADPDVALPSDTEPVQAGLELARRFATVAERLGQDPWAYLRLLATLGALDLTVARAAEPHLDAVATLAQAGLAPEEVASPDATWGVYAARAPALSLQAETDADGRWRLTGRKPWCSLPDAVTHALVTAGADDGYRLFAVDMRDPGIAADSSGWRPRGLVDISTATLTLTDVPAVPVGGPGWYLDRPGFAWGGIGVAAVWFGGAAAVAGKLVASAVSREPDQLALAHLGACDVALTSALAVLRSTAERIAADPEGADAEGALLAVRARSVVARTVDVVLEQVGHATGPAPLALDAEHAARVADLTLYVRQHHADRDLAVLGRLLLPDVES